MIKLNLGVFLALFVALLYSCKPEPVLPYFGIENQNACVIDENDHIYISTTDSLYRFGSNKFEHLHFVGEGATINGMAVGVNSDIWLASSEGLVNYTEDTIFVSAADSLNTSDFEQVAIDESGNFYVVTSDDVAVYYNGRWYRTEGNDEIFRNEEVTDIAVASNNYVYVTTMGGGVGRFHVGVDGISGATNFDTDWSWLQSNNVRTVFVDDTVQWFGSEGGVAVHYSELTKWDWEVYSTVDGLISDTIISIAKDGSGAMWFGSYRGVSSYDGENWTNYHYNLGSGQIAGDTIPFIVVDGAGDPWLTYAHGIMHYTEGEFLNISKR